MKKIVIIPFIFLSFFAKSQNMKYYFMEIRTTGKGQVEIQPEMGVAYPEIDSLLVSARETKKNGAVIITGKKYESFSAVFNKLSSAGLKFIQFASLPTFGGGTALLVNDLRLNYMIWCKLENR